MGLPRGTQIAYIPSHAGTDLAHHDVEFGFATSGPNKDGDYFCRYWRKGQIGILRTRFNSELTPGSRITEHKTVSQEVVQAILDRIDAEKDL